MSVQHSLLIGVFNETSLAEQAIEDLRNVGIPDNRIRYSRASTSGSFMENLKSLFTDQNATSNSLASDLTDLGLSQDEVQYYTREYDAGRSIVAVDANGQEQNARAILSSYGATPYTAQAGSYNQPTGYSQNADYAQSPTGHNQRANYDQVSNDARSLNYADETDGNERRSVKIREEQLGAEKRQVRSGEVRLHKEVVTEQRRIDVPVTHEEVVIEHHPVEGGRVSDTPIRDNETIRVPISREEVTVTKNPVETGEVTIRKRAVQENQQVTDNVRREKVRLEREGDANIRTNNNVE